nr:hypothetical protein [Tanacetum cinerariifolium]
MFRLKKKTISKNALKKEMGNKKKEEERRLKEEEKAKKAAADDQDMDPTLHFNNRLSTLAAQKKVGSIGKENKNSLAGRLMNKRSSSSKLFFYDLHGPEGKVQVMADLRNSQLDEAEFSKLHNSVKRGDIVAVAENPNAKKIDARTPGSGRNPEAYTLKDQEKRYRQCYPDLMELTGGYKIKYHANGLDNEAIEIDFTPPFRWIDMIAGLEEIAKLSIPKDLASEKANKYLADACLKLDVRCPPPQTTA